MTEKYEAVIIGGGVNGLGTAYHLGKKGFTDVLVLDKSYLGYGASGRNGGGIRQQWTSEDNIKLARESRKMFERLDDELEEDLEFYQGGYLVLSFHEEEAAEFKENVKLQNKLGVDSKFLSPEEAKEIVPELDISDVVAATFNQSDGTIYPFKVIHGYADRVREIGIDIKEHTEVTDIVTQGDEIKKVKTSEGNIKTDTVINAAGGWSSKVAEMAGAEIPNVPVRHEIMVTEPYKRFLDPMVISFEHGIYFSQSEHGNIVGGIGNPDEEPGLNQKGSLWFLKNFSDTLLDFIPRFSGVHMIRQWAGFYDTTPDAQPILGSVPEIERFYQVNGFSGHGFMVSPMVDKVTAELILGEQPSMDIERLRVERFEDMDLEEEGGVVG
ncbi:MAG: FAD-binding oxidoreductase [Candidatus Thermoplasmatota archaeon]|nr:FAD-binding oxidoreductase [Candidatus Thermoplasmatota archaeon]